MKKTLSFFLILISIFLVSCENPLSKSIFEPLPPEIIQKQSLQDSTFIGEYEYIRKLADSVFISKSVSPQYSSLEYSDFFDFYEKGNKEIMDLKESEATKELWIKKYGLDIEKFRQDSIKFHEYILENDYHNFLDIELLKIYEKRIWVSRYTYLDFMFKPKNGVGIRKIAGYIYFFPKSEKYDSLSITQQEPKKAAFFSFTGYNKKDFKYSGSSNGYELSDLEGIPVEILMQKYDLRYRIHELVIDDKFIDSRFDSVPYSMKEVFIGKYPFYKEFYIQEFVNPNFKEFSRFVSDSAFNTTSVNFPLVSEFLRSGSDKYNKLKEGN
jgi:hypothetical protein